MAFSSSVKRPATWSWLDLLIAVAVTLFGLYWLTLREGGGAAAREVHIYRHDALVATAPLDAARQIDLTAHGVAMVIEIRDQQVRVLSSSCNQQICVRKGWTAQVHDPIICIPNRVTIEVTGSDARYDAISR